MCGGNTRDDVVGAGVGRNLIWPSATFSTQESAEKGWDQDLPQSQQFDGGHNAVPSPRFFSVEKVPEERMRSLLRDVSLQRLRRSIAPQHGQPICERSSKAFIFCDIAIDIVHA
jgi:hypothetical protein